MRLLSPIEWRLLKRIVKDGLISILMSAPPCVYLFPEAPRFTIYITASATLTVMFSTALHWRFRRFILTKKLIHDKRSAIQINADKVDV